MIELHATSDIQNTLSNNYLLPDNDFLSELYKNINFLKKFIEYSSRSNILLESMVAFEFLRDVFDPKYRQAKEKFLDNEFFNKTTNHVSIFNKIQDSALLLSKIYAHQGKSKGVSNTDLYLAARMMSLPKNSLLITGNKIHFPSCIFTLVTIISLYDSISENVQNYYVLKFDQNSFNFSYNKFTKMESKVKSSTN
jgi:hypothetical protein